MNRKQRFAALVIQADLTILRNLFRIFLPEWDPGLQSTPQGLQPTFSHTFQRYRVLLLYHLTEYHRYSSISSSTPLCTLNRVIPEFAKLVIFSPYIVAQNEILTVMISIPVIVFVPLGRSCILDDSAITCEQTRLAHCRQIAVQKFLAVR
jgi:hypothetical protein